MVLKQRLVTESPLKMIKKTFYFTLKAFFVLKIFKILFWYFGLVGNTIAIRIMPNISRSKGNEIWSVNSLTWETFFLKNHTQNMLEKLVPDPFIKKIEDISDLKI